MENLNYKLESLLFVSNKPIEITKLAKICNADKKQISECLKNLAMEYKNSGRGIRLVIKSNEAQMVAAPEFSKIVEKITIGELAEDLSKASLETLTIIAYKGPLTRVELEAIRGVNCLYILRNLLIRGLVEKKQHSKDSRLNVYEVSVKFLRHLGLTKVEELPNFQKVRNDLKIQSTK